MPDRSSKRNDNRLWRLMLDPETFFQGIGKLSVFDNVNDATIDIGVSRDEGLQLVVCSVAA